MAGLILKSPYIKAGGAGKYMRYIATRENVERLPDSRPPTKKQMELVQKLTRDFPASTKSDEFTEYSKSPTRAKASAYISSALEANWNAAQRSDVYMKYIATRPRAEKLGTHGLFGDEDDVDLNAAIAKMESVTGNVWTHIISLKREDAERLGYDNASSWRNLLRAHRNDIADAMRIAPNDFRWYAAFHNEGDHPHVHMMAWSASGEGYLSRDGIRKIKSGLVNDIFRQELLHTYEQKSGMRDELVNEVRQSLQELVGQMSKSTALPKAISSAIDGRLGMLEDRLSALQFNNAVELDMLVQIIASEYNLGPGYLRKLRSDSVKNVKQTSGRVSLANAVKESDEAEWQG